MKWLINVVHLDVDEIMCQRRELPKLQHSYFQKRSGFTTRMVKKIPRDFTVTNNTVICVEHFEEDDITCYKTQHQPEGKHLRNY